jgi:hypothetical protein
MSGFANTASKSLLAWGMLAGFVCTGGALSPVLAAETIGATVPDFAPDSSTAWIPDRPTGDDFLPPVSGPGPVMSAKDRPYVPNGRGAQPTYRIADLSNPILRPWAMEQMRKANDEVIAGKIPYTPGSGVGRQASRASRSIRASRACIFCRAPPRSRSSANSTSSRGRSI